MAEHRGEDHVDGWVPDGARCGDILAIQGLAVAYGHAVDDADWARWAGLFTDDAVIDYTHSGGIAGTVSELAAWMPDAMSVFTWSLHSVLTHEIHFTGADTARGRSHVLNRNGIDWEGERELVEVSGLYLDEYRRVGDRWRFAARVEESRSITGGRFAAIVRDLTATTAPDRPQPWG